MRTSNSPNVNEGRWLRIEVADTGIGIDHDTLEQIFLPFDQGHLKGDHRFGGMGLGLAIARSVVSLHGGRITAESGGPDQGSTFTVELPGAVEIKVDSLAAKPSPQSPPAPVGAKLVPLRLLLVDDHPSTLKVLGQLLQRDGHQVTAVTSVKDALKAAATNTFDLLISDLGLPDGTGHELMEILRATYGLRGIAMTGYSAGDDLTRSNTAGFVAHLVKPVAIADLRNTLVSLQRRVT